MEVVEKETDGVHYPALGLTYSKVRRTIPFLSLSVEVPGTLPARSSGCSIGSSIDRSYCVSVLFPRLR